MPFMDRLLPSVNPSKYLLGHLFMYLSMMISYTGYGVCKYPSQVSGASNSDVLCIYIYGSVDNSNSVHN